MSDEILNIITEQYQSAQDLWTAAEDLFHDNKKRQVIYLTAEFGSMVQGDLTITAYYTKLKSIADALCDIDQPVFDKSLVLNILRGLSLSLSHATFHRIPADALSQFCSRTFHAPSRRDACQQH